MTYLVWFLQVQFPTPFLPFSLSFLHPLQPGAAIPYFLTVRSLPAWYLTLGVGPCPSRPAVVAGGRNSRSSWKRKRPRKLQESRPRAGRAMLSQGLSLDVSGETGTGYSLGEQSLPHPPWEPIREPQAAEVCMAGGGGGMQGNGPVSSPVCPQRVSLPSFSQASLCPTLPSELKSSCSPSLMISLHQ